MVALLDLTFVISRENYVRLLLDFGVLFGCYYFLCRFCFNKLHLLLGLVILARLVLVFALPNLSDDYFRFVWDGRLLMNNENPFLHLPDYYLNSSLIENLGENIYNQLNSPHYYSIYPPVCQFVFGISSTLFPDSIYGNVVVMKLFFFLSEVGSIFFIYKILEFFEKPLHWVLLYALNPLVVVEFCGNLHFEALMIFFTLGSIYLLMKNKWIGASILFALAICTKLIPMIFLPFFLPLLGWKKSLKFWMLIGVFTIFFFLPFYNLQLIQNIGESANLYFQSFEFNASVYYLIRSIGYWLTGYNIIGKIGAILPLFTMLGILFLAFYRGAKNNLQLFKKLSFGLLIYLLMATTVHPWYIIPLVAFSSFHHYRFPMVWSAIVVLTYYTYRDNTYTENLWLVGVEYILVSLFLLYESRLNRLDDNELSG